MKITIKLPDRQQILAISLITVLLSFLSMSGWAGIRICKFREFDDNVTDVLKYSKCEKYSESRKEMLRNHALDYLEKNNIKKGSTNLFGKSPLNDVGYWIENIDTEEIPGGISIFPHNKEYLLWIISSILIFIFSLIVACFTE